MHCWLTELNAVYNALLLLLTLTNMCKIMHVIHLMINVGHYSVASPVIYMSKYREGRKARTRTYTDQKTTQKRQTNNAQTVSNVYIMYK